MKDTAHSNNLLICSIVLNLGSFQQWFQEQLEVQGLKD